MERDPNGKGVKEGGAKLDFGKAAVFQGALAYFPRAILEVADVSTKGAAKYSWKGWETVPDGFNRYSDALGRHLVLEQFEERDPDLGVLHAAQVAWNALARLELKLREIEDEREKGPEPKTIGNPLVDGWPDSGDIYKDISREIRNIAQGDIQTFEEADLRGA